jgi:hypothetical protein
LVHDTCTFEPAAAVGVKDSLTLAQSGTGWPCVNGMSAPVKLAEFGSAPDELRSSVGATTAPVYGAANVVPVRS